jgi:hypothetical protein
VLDRVSIARLRFEKTIPTNAPPKASVAGADKSSTPLLTAPGTSDIYFLDCREKFRESLRAWNCGSVRELVVDGDGRFVRTAGIHLGG